MKIVNVGNTYRTYDNSVKTFDELPAQMYIVRFDKMSGFFLEKYADIEIKEKVYGVHESKVNKVIRAFPKSQKNLGVILSGDKGIGKSLFAKALSIAAIKKGMPVVVVDRYIPGIASFLEEIEQEVMVLFDEFDKTFGGVKKEDEMADPQTEMLTLFDGISQGKKLFVITCNSLGLLNDYLVNRPGRFHYHFRFGYPSDAEIKEYLKDKVEDEYHGEIEKVVNFAHRVDLNYDCLRSIAFELNTGLSFEEAIKDLNILNLGDIVYKTVLHLKDGRKAEMNKTLDLFDKEHDNIIDFKVGEVYVDAIYKTSSYEFDYSKGIIYVKGNDIRLEDGGYNDDEEIKSIKEMEADYITVEKIKKEKIHYAL